MSDRRCWLEVDLGRLRENYRILQGRCRPGCTLIGVVKANAYGMGAPAVARALTEEGCAMLSTADLAEALELRRAGIRAPILLLGPIGPEGVEEACREDIVVPVVDLENGRRLETEAARLGLRLRTHIKVDVGLTRLGIPVPSREEAAAREVEAIAALPHLTSEGLMTHISGVMDPALDYRNVEQMELFLRFGRRLEEKGLRLKMHCESSLLYLSHPEYQMDYVRLTSALLGIQPGGEKLGLGCVAQLKTRLLQIKRIPAGTSVGYWMTFTAPQDMVIGVVGVGYGDGLIRSLCGGAPMLVRGRRTTVVGKLSMSFAVVDLTHIPEAAVGDTVTVFGRDGEEAVSVQEYAALYGGHACEVVTMLKESIHKIYLP